MAKEQFFRVGRIINTHGLKGQVKVMPTTDDMKRFEDLDEVYIEFPKKKMPVHVKQVQYFKNTVILRFEEFNDINQVMELKGKDILIDRKDAVPLEEGEFYVADMIGARVFTDEQMEGGNSADGVEPFGKVTNIFPTGANMVLDIRHKGKSVLVPLIKECVRETNVEEQYFVIHLMKGLM